MRPATVDDLPRLLEMGRKFHAQFPQRWAFNEEDTAATFLALIESQFVAIDDGGFIAGVCQKNPLNRGWIIAKEFLWWSENGGGRRLAKAFRDWAVAQGADEIQWSHPHGNDRAARILAAMAAPCEHVYSEYTKCV